MRRHATTNTGTDGFVFKFHVSSQLTTCVRIFTPSAPTLPSS